MYTFKINNKEPVKKVLLPFCIYPFKYQTHKMVKHTQTIRRQQPTNCLSVTNHLVGLALKGLRSFRHHQSTLYIIDIEYF